MTSPLVTVICLCYNHQRFVREALQSVFNQTYPSIQLIVVDDASNDQSKSIIREMLKDHPQVIFIDNEENAGNCKAFNTGLKHAKGGFIIDLAADDVLEPQRVEIGLSEFSRYSSDFGVQYTDAQLIGEEGDNLGLHSSRFPPPHVMDGDLYQELIRRYFISSPTMMIKKEVLESLNGYDETLAYEDFDFWIRSSRKFRYCYVPKALVRRRVVKGSMSQMQFKGANMQQHTTYKVCEKILQLNRNEFEKKALAKRIRYELIHRLEHGDLALAFQYVALWNRNRKMVY